MAYLDPSGRGFPIRPKFDLAPTRRSLLTRLKRWDDQDAWKQFFDAYSTLIHTAAINAGLTDAEANDVLQETLLAVAKAMPSFHYAEKDGSFRAWLLCLTRWRIVDQFRQRGIVASSGEPDDDYESASRAEIVKPQIDPEGAEFAAMWDAEFDDCVLNAALERIKRKVDPSSFQIFDLLVVQKWPVPKVATFLHRSRPYVHLCSHRVGKLIKAEIAKLKRKSI